MQTPLVIVEQNIIPTATVQVEQTKRAFELTRLRA